MKSIRCTATTFSPRTGKPCQCAAKAADGEFCAQHGAMFAFMAPRPVKAVQR